MQSRPVIGIATQTQEPIPGELPRVWIMGQKYIHVLRTVGALPWLIPLLQDDEDTLRAIYERLDAVFLTGGVDVDPSTYQETRTSLCGVTDPERDWTEVRLIRWALEDGKPLLGVCRGIQAINVACGGTLYQDLTAQYPNAIKHDYFPTPTQWSRDYLAHDITIDPQSRLGAILGAERLLVNSMHHQGVQRLAPGLRPSAFAPDGLIEGFEGTNGSFVLAVQWHPEELAATHEPMRRLFSAFVEAARAFAHAPTSP